MSDQLPETIAKIVESEIAKQVYKQGLSGAVSQAGKLAEDVVKAARLFTFPIQILATLQDRIDATTKRAIDMVPAERQIESPPQIAGPVFEKMRFLPADDLLNQMFEELLARSIDRDRVNEAHPAFVHIISQLSRDEAIILFLLKDRAFEITDLMDFDQPNNRFYNRRVEKSTIPTEKLFFSGNVDLYYSHLESLSLVEWPVYRQDPIMIQARQTGIRRHSRMNLTAFGKLFVTACVPKDGFR